MALALSTLAVPVNNQLIDPSTGVMREDWQQYFAKLTKQLNGAVGELGTDLAPADAQYLVGAASAGLSAERVATNSTSNTWNLSVAGQAAVERAALTGDVTAGANSNALTIADDAVTYAKMQNISATARILGRKTAAAGNTEECTLSEVLDFIGSPAQGDVLYRGAASWARLGAGTNGQFLKTQGAAANPLWADVPSGLTLLTSGTVSAAATLDLVLSAYTAYRGILFAFSAFVPATDSVSFQTRVSSDGGATFNAGATDYRYTSFGSFDDSATTTSATRSTGASSIIMTNGTVGNVASSEGIEGLVWLFNQTATGRHSRLHWDINAILENGVTHRCSGVGRRQTSQDTDAVRFLFSSGNIASGNYAVYGLS